MTHQRYLVEISRQIANYLEDKPCQVFSAPFDVFLPAPNETEDKTSTIVQPDKSIIYDKSKLSEKGCTGCPDIVIEIVSPKGASSFEILPEFKLNLLKIFGPEEQVTEPSPKKYKRL